MKILISTLLFEIAVFLNYDQLHVSGIILGGTFHRLGRHISNRELPSKVVWYKDSKIGLYKNPDGTVRKISLLNNTRIPNNAYLMQHDVAIRPVIFDNVKFWVYLEHGHVLAAQYNPLLDAPYAVPSMTHAREHLLHTRLQLHKDHLSLHKDDERSFVYKHQKIAVWVDTFGKVQAVGLDPTNIFPTRQESIRFNIKSRLENEHNLFFVVYYLPNNKILGAYLAPGWN